MQLLAGWIKCSEWIVIGGLLLPYLFRELVDKRTYDVLCGLSDNMHDICAPGSSKSNADSLHEAVLGTVREFYGVFPKAERTFMVHLFCHIPHQIGRWGPSRDSWNFGSERSLCLALNGFSGCDNHPLAVQEHFFPFIFHFLAAASRSQLAERAPEAVACLRLPFAYAWPP